MNIATTSRIQKITSKGQITLPIAWRRKVQTDMIMVRETIKGIEIIPSRTLKVGTEDRDDDIIIFDANRYNGGVGIEASVFADTLRHSIAKDMRKKRYNERTR